MKKMAWIAVFVIMVSLGMVSHAPAGVAVGGMWKGSAKRVTSKGCNIVSVIVILNQCTKSNLVWGSLQVGSSFVIGIVGRVDTDNTISLHGQESGGGSYSMATLLGTYVVGAPPKIVVQGLSTTDIDMGTYGPEQEFDVFTLTKQ